MSDGLPSDSALKAYLEKRVHGAKEISLLSRAILKDGIADQFHLTEEQREELDLDSRYKKLIKVWIQEAIDNMPDEQRSSQGTGTGRQGETGSEERREEIADVGASESDEDGGGHLSQFSSLDEEVEPAKEKRKPQRSRVSKGARIKKGGASKGSRDSTAAKLKKLKGLVLLCGTRKPWKKLFEEAGCANDEGADEETTKVARKRQVRLIEGVLQDIGMTGPYTKDKAAEIKRQREVQQDVEAIQMANQTERSATRGRGKRNASSTPEEERSSKAAVTMMPDTRKFNRSLADFAAELND